MLNPELKLNPKLWNDDVLQLPIRQGFGEGLLDAGKKDASIVALCADLTESTKMNLFKEQFPERFIELGVAEQNLVTTASGLAAVGKLPFVSSYAMFSPGRNWEQIRTTITYNDRAVIIAGSHAGISVGPDGGTHQALEDIALMRVLPNIVVISPADSFEARRATIALAKLRKPAYIRLAREKTPIITTEDTPFELGKGYILWQPESGSASVGIIATGSLVYEALRAARDLEKSGIKIKVLNLPTIKPIDKDAIISLAKETKRIITVEEHQIAGGMGSAVAEVLSENYPVRIKMIGVHDLYGQSGKPYELLAHYGLDRDAITKAVKEILQQNIS